MVALDARKWYKDWRDIHEAWFLKGDNVNSVNSVYVLSYIAKLGMPT